MSSGGASPAPAVAGLAAGSHDVFERWYTAHERADTAALAEVLADDVVVHSLFRPEPIRGREAAVAHFVLTTTTFSELSMTMISTPAVAGDGTVLAEVEFTGAFTGSLTWRGGLHRGGGQRFQVRGVVVVGVTDGAVASVRTLFDRDDWLRQVGVPAG